MSYAQATLCLDMHIFEEEGIDMEDADEDAILEADEVFAIGDGRYLIVEG